MYYIQYLSSQFPSFGPTASKSASLGMAPKISMQTITLVLEQPQLFPNRAVPEE